MADKIKDGRNINKAQDEWQNDGIEFTQNSNTYKLVRALTSQADRIDDEIDKIRQSHHIDTATGEALDRIGELVQLTRKSNESDEKFRARIKVQFRVGNIGTTFDEFSEFSSVLLNTDIDNIEYIFNYENRPATVQIATQTEVYENSPLTRNEVSEFLSRAVPAGHEVNPLEKGSFRLKTDSDTNDSSKGLTSDSVSTGGTVAADIL